MTQSKILPDLQCSLLCEEVRQEINGSFLLIGVFHAVRVPEVPVTAPRLCLFNRWTAGYGQFIETIRLIAPDQVTVLRKHESKFSLQEVTQHAINVVMLGAYLALSQTVRKASIVAAIEDVLGPGKKHLLDINLKALDAGIAFAANVQV